MWPVLFRWYDEYVFSNLQGAPDEAGHIECGDEWALIESPHTQVCQSFFLTEATKDHAVITNIKTAMPHFLCLHMTESCKNELHYRASVAQQASSDMCCNIIVIVQYI